MKVKLKLDCTVDSFLIFIFPSLGEVLQYPHHMLLISFAADQSLLKATVSVSVG